MVRTNRRPVGFRRLTLSGRFVLISLLGIAVVAVGVVAATSQVMQHQSIAEGVSTAETLAEWVTPSVPLRAFEVGVLEPQDTAALDTATSSLDPGEVQLRLWTVDGAVLYDTASRTYAGFPDSGRLESAAILGVPAPRIETRFSGAKAGSVGGSRTVLSVYLPVRRGERVVGVAEVAMDHTAAAQAQAAATRTISLAAGAGLLLLWLVLYRTVHTASRNLQRSAMENARMALLDALTGLPNRRMLLDRLDRAVQAAHAGGPGVGILLLDVDRFKEINDTLGHDAGDDLLTQVSARMQGAFRGRDLVARLGGDEFAVLLAVDSVDDAEQLAHRARGVFAQPFALGEITVHVATSIGVAVLPDHADDARGLMRKADIAMYAAKQHRLGVSVYDRRVRRLQPVAPGAPGRAARLAVQARRARGALPAQDRPGHRADRRARGAPAVAPPDPRLRSRPPCSSRSPSSPV